MINDIGGGFGIKWRYKIISEKDGISNFEVV